MMISHPFAWFASILYGTEAVLGKLVSKHGIHNPWLFNFLWTLGILALTAPVALWYGVGLPSQWLDILGASLFGALGSVLYVLALYRLDISVLAPLFSIRTALAILAGALYLGEALSLQQALLVTVIVTAGLFVSFDERFSVRSFFNRGVAFAVLDMIALVIMAAFIKHGVAAVGYWNITFWSALAGQGWLLFTLPLFVKDIRAVTSQQLGSVLVVALAGTAGTLAVNKAYADNVGITSTITSLPFSMVAAVLFSVFAPRLLESHPVRVYIVRFVAAAAMIAAALML